MAHDKITATAIVAHEVNRAYCVAIGDYSQVPWDEAQEWQRDSALSNVKFHLDNLGAGPAASHENWLADKERQGWTHGAVKDEAKKTHPCIVPFDKLPPELQAKDFLFHAVVHAMRKALA